MRDIITLGMKDVKILLRDKAGLFWVLGFPIVLAVLIGSIFSGEGETASMEIALIDLDKTEQSQAFAERLGDNDALELKVTTLEKAKNDVRRGDIVAYLLIKEGFGAESAFYSTSDESTLEIGIDPKRKAESGYLNGMISQAWFGGMQDAMSNPETMHSQVEDALAGLEESDMSAEQQETYTSFLTELDSFVGETGSTEDGGGMEMQGPSIEQVEVTREQSGPATAFEISFPQAIVWGLISVVSTFALTIVRERTGGTMLRLLVSPIGNTKILASKGLACFLSAAGVIVVLLLIGRLAFGVRLDNIGQLVLAISSASLCFVGMMMLLSVLGKTEQAVSGVGWAVMMMFAMIGGGMIPLMVMPAWMLQVSNFSPVKWAITALEGAIWRGYDFGEMMLPCGILLAVGLVCYLSGVVILSKQKN